MSLKAQRILGVLVVLVLIGIAGTVWYKNSQSQAVGTIEFGQSYTSDLTITNPTTTFSPGQTVAYVAHLPGGAGALSLTESFVKVQANGVEQSLMVLPLAISDPTFDTVAHKLTAAQLTVLTMSAGNSYAIRIYRGDTKLAEGTFVISP